MHRTNLLFSLLFLTVSASPAAKVDSAADEDLTVRVRIQDYAHVHPKILERALATAGRVLDRSGIEATFLLCPLTMEELAVNNTCEIPTDRTDLYARILSPDMQPEVSNATHTYGIALVSGSKTPQFLSILYENVERLAFERDQNSAYDAAQRNVPLQRYVGVLLGHVLAHEVGHLLLGTNSHAKQGLMKAHWSPSDLRDALVGRLGFDGKQARKIQKDIERRLSAVH